MYNFICWKCWLIIKRDCFLRHCFYVTEQRWCFVPWRIWRRFQERSFHYASVISVLGYTVDINFMFKSHWQISCLIQGYAAKQSRLHTVHRGNILLGPEINLTLARLTETWWDSLRFLSFNGKSVIGECKMFSRNLSTI